MQEHFINELMVRLDGKIPPIYWDIILKELRYQLNEYDVAKKSTELVVYDMGTTEHYKAFFVSKKVEGMSAGSLALYKTYIDLFFDYVKKPVAMISANDVRIFLYQIQKDRNVSDRTLETIRAIINSFFEWSTIEGYIGANPCRVIKPIKHEVKERKPLTNLELEMVRQACKTTREQAIVEVMYSTGCRVTELERLNINDVNFDTKEVALFGKGDKHRTSYISARAEVALKRYLAERTDGDEALFVYAVKPNDRLKKAGIECLIKHIGNEAGIDRLHPHLLRHTMATDALSRGMDVAEIQKVLGHSNVDTTMIYAKINDTEVKRKHSKCIV